MRPHRPALTSAERSPTDWTLVGARALRHRWDVLAAAAQRALLHADQGDQACDQAPDPEREHPPEDVSEIDAERVRRRCAHDGDVAPAFGRAAEPRPQEGHHDAA